MITLRDLPDASDALHDCVFAPAGRVPAMKIKRQSPQRLPRVSGFKSSKSFRSSQAVQSWGAAPRKPNRVHQVNLTGTMEGYVWSINGVPPRQRGIRFPAAVRRHLLDALASGPARTGAVGGAVHHSRSQEGVVFHVVQIWPAASRRCRATPQYFQRVIACVGLVVRRMCSNII